MKVPAKLTKVLEQHLPTDTSSSRAIQRVAALYLGHTAGAITNDGLRELCRALLLFDYEGATGRNTFGANFTVNMKKDEAYFAGDYANGWKLTADGKAEAKRIFDQGEAPTRRRSSGNPKAAKAPKAKAAKKAPNPKAAKKAPAVKKAPAAKKAKEAKPKAAKKAPTKKAEKKTDPKATTTDDDRAKRKAAARKKKRNLKPETTPATVVDSIEESSAPEPSTAPATAGA